MGTYLTAGHTYSDSSPNNVVNGANLNEHVNNAVFETTSISSQTLKDPAALSDEILINDGGSFKKITLQQIHDLILYPGSIVQVASGEYTANSNLTVVIPSDDTIPQNTEGTEIISVSITPRFATSIILASFTGQFTINAITNGIAALFRDTGANAIAAQFAGSDAASSTQFRGVWKVDYMDSPATTSATAYKIRVGPGSAATMRLNGTATARLLGGVSRAVLTIMEIKQ